MVLFLDDNVEVELLRVWMVLKIGVYFRSCLRWEDGESGSYREFEWSGSMDYGGDDIVYFLRSSEVLFIFFIFWLSKDVSVALYRFLILW